MKFPNAIKGLKKIYLGEILSLLGAVLAVAMLVLLAVHHIDIDDASDAGVKALNASGMLIPFVLYAVGSIVLILVSFILNLVGLIQASRDEDYFKRALIVAAIGVAVSMLITGLQKSAVAGNWLQVASTVCNTLLTVLVLGGIGSIANKIGNKEVAGLSEQCSKVVIYPMACSVVVEILIAVMSLNESTVTMLSIAIGVLDVIAYVLYLRVLSKARIMQ